MVCIHLLVIIKRGLHDKMHNTNIHKCHLLMHLYLLVDLSSIQ